MINVKGVFGIFVTAPFTILIGNIDMNKRKKKLFIVTVLAVSVLLFLIFALKNIKIDDFHPASVIFVVDSSASNQTKLDEQKRFVKQLCSRLDPEDKVKIIRVSEEAYLIFEGSPHSSKNISESMDTFTQYDEKEWGTAYGLGIEKAIGYSLTMSKEGYVPAIVVVGDLENEWAREKQIDWNSLPQKIQNLQKTSPDFSMMFAFAHPQKLDFVKSELADVLGETRLIVSTEQNIDKAMNEFLRTIER